MLAQVSLEFIVFVSILSVLLLMTIYYNSSYSVQINAERNYNDAQIASDHIASEINMALKAGDGYTKVFYTPDKISDMLDYDVSVDNYLLVLRWSDGYVRSVILAKGITGSVEKGRNIIKNVDGSIYVNQ